MLLDRPLFREHQENQVGLVFQQYQVVLVGQEYHLNLLCPEVLVILLYLFHHVDRLVQ